jgi:dipeptidyl aminopeptidase/acylaminoacyl peptidase
MAGSFRRASCALLCVLGLAASTAAWGMDEIEPGEVPRLDADEGLLVVAIDSNIPLESVKLRREDAILGAGTLRNIPVGRSYRVFVAEAGDYEWAQLRPFRDFWFDFRDKPGNDFRVEAGRISYAGDLVFRAAALQDTDWYVTNRGLGAIDWLRRTHPALYDRHDVVYSGRDPDPFPAFYRDIANDAAAEATDGALRAPPDPGALPLPVRTLWKDSRVLQARMNGAGDLIAIEVRKGERHFAIDLVDLVEGTVSSIAASDVEFDWVSWSGDRVLVLPSLDQEDLSIVRIGESKAGKRAFERLHVPRTGTVIDPLVREPDRVLFASRDLRDQLMVHRLDISSQAAIDRSGFKFQDRLNTYVSRDVAWFADAAGRLRMGLVQRTMKDEAGEDEERLVLVHGLDGRFRDVAVLDKEEPLDPVGLSADGHRIYAITEMDRQQKELVEIDPATGRITRTVFARDGVDVVGPLYDARRELAGVLYYQGGRLVSEYFDADASTRSAMLRAAFPGQTVVVADRSRDNTQLLLWVESGRQPAQLYHLDAGALRASLVDESMPWIDAGAMAPTHRMDVASSDGVRVEAFLTLPAGQGKRPLVVFPHGGPIGVADRNGFDRQVQFLASLGYAVLRVNFRGSEGYGRAFREAGHGQFGLGIEDDIDAAIRQAIATHPVDGGRMCALGASYGGYSSLVLATRWPGRFRCVVSIAGPSDRILAFSASDFGRNESLRPLVVKLMGDPATDLAAMRERSPLYRYRALDVPVMLVHGREDKRVDYEHMLRLQRVLALDGRPPVGLVFAEEAHGVEDLDNLEVLWRGVAGFLGSHLGHGGGAAGAAKAGR